MTEIGVFDPLLAKALIKNQAQSSTTLSRPMPSPTGDPMFDDFRVFLTALWRFLKLPDPTPLQLDVAYYLQHHGWNGEIDRQVVMAFRGMAKSWITAAYVLWNLYRNCQMKIGVFSGSGTRAKNFTKFCFQIIMEWSVLAHLRPRAEQRQSATEFDVRDALPDQTPSVFAFGITAAVVGYRADLIVGDDVETNKNSMTPEMREKIADGVREFDAIIKPGGQIIFLGTPQTESSIYNLLPARGYTITVWPARFPTGKQMRAYGGRLARFITWMLEKNPGLVGHSTEPSRFSDEDLAGRELSWGKAGFALQYMLDTSLSDVERYPLRLSNLIVMSLDRRSAPDLVSWGNGEHLRLRDVEPVALDGDHLYGPASVSQGHSPYQAIYAFIDPSGEGKDETTLTIGGLLHSHVFVLKQAGWQDGFGEKTLREIANLLVVFGVQVCRVEEDFGMGMFAQLLRPYVKEAWADYNRKLPRRPSDPDRSNTEVVSEKSAKVQKEKRIIEVLRPAFDAHRVVMAKEVLAEDYRQMLERDGSDLRDRYSLMYQITRLTDERDCLTHDDRVEGLSGLVGMFVEQLGLAPQEQAEDAEERRMEEAIARLQDEHDRIGGRGYSNRPLRGNLRTGRQRAGARR